MPASLAEQLYARWRELLPADSIWTAWATLDPQYRGAWERVAEAAGDVEKQNRAEQQATEAAIELDVIANLNTAIQKLQAENEQLTRQRDEAQRAVRDGFPAIVAVIRQQRDEAQALAKEACDLVEAHIVPNVEPNRKETLTRVAEIRAALEHKS